MQCRALVGRGRRLHCSSAFAANACRHKHDVQPHSINLCSFAEHVYFEHRHFDIVLLSSLVPLSLQ